MDIKACSSYSYSSIITYCCNTVCRSGYTGSAQCLSVLVCLCPLLPWYCWWNWFGWNHYQIWRANLLQQQKAFQAIKGISFFFLFFCLATLSIFVPFKHCISVELQDFQIDLAKIISLQFMNSRWAIPSSEHSSLSINPGEAVIMPQPPRPVLNCCSRAANWKCDLNIAWNG